MAEDGHQRGKCILTLLYAFVKINSDSYLPAL